MKKCQVIVLKPETQLAHSPSTRPSDHKGVLIEPSPTRKYPRGDHADFARIELSQSLEKIGLLETNVIVADDDPRRQIASRFLKPLQALLRPAKVSSIRGAVVKPDVFSGLAM